MAVQAYAVSFLKDGVLQKVVLPYSVAAIGDGAFYRSGITEYTFESVNAPALEYSYDQTVVDYLTENMVQNRTRSYFNVNFETCVLDYSQYGEKAGKSPLIAKFPVNGVGYDNFLYKTYFGTRETTVIVMTEKTRTATELIDGFPTADEIMAWAENINDENKAKVEALATDAKTARAYANTALSDEAQAEYLGAERVTKLESVETALRAAKKAYGIEVKIARLSYDKNSPFKQEYLVGETFDMSALVITVEYDDGSKETADLSKMTLVTNRPLTALDQVVTLSGYGRTINILVSVKENAPGSGEDNSSSSSEVSEEKGGCKSSIASFAAVCALGAVGVMMARKRKENRE